MMERKKEAKRRPNQDEGGESNRRRGGEVEVKKERRKKGDKKATTTKIDNTNNDNNNIGSANITSSFVSRVCSSPGFDIVRTSHVEFLVTDLEKSRDFYVRSLGLIETERTRDQIYLRGVEDRFHHCLILTESEEPAVSHIAFRVRTKLDLQKIAELLERSKLRYRWLEPGTEERSRGIAIRVQDPLGFPVEFFSEIEESEWLWQSFDKHLGARIMRIDHVNLLVPNVGKGSDWYENGLGFICTEYTETGDPEPKLWATWLRRKPTVHDVALMTGAGPRLHHAGFFVNDKHSIMDAADILASRGYLNSIERGPGRHGISNAFFLYLRDPDGHRVELYTGDYLSADPGWRAIKWKLDDPQRQTFWGAPAPSSWFNEASEVISVFEPEKKIETSKPGI
jgi:catechol 2,3-dioxygenase